MRLLILSQECYIIKYNAPNRWHVVCVSLATYYYVYTYARSGGGWWWEDSHNMQGATFRCRSPREIVHDAICLLPHLTYPSTPITHTPQSAFLRNRISCFFSVPDLCEKWRFDNTAGRMDFIIYSVMYVNKKIKIKKYIKEKRNHTVVLCLGMDFHLFIFFLPLSSVFFWQKSFLYGRTVFVSLSYSLALPPPFTHSLFHTLTNAAHHIYFSWEKTLLSFFIIIVSRFRHFGLCCLFVCHNDCRLSERWRCHVMCEWV